MTNENTKATDMKKSKGRSAHAHGLHPLSKQQQTKKKPTSWVELHSARGSLIWLTFSIPMHWQKKRHIRVISQRNGPKKIGIHFFRPNFVISSTAGADSSWAKLEFLLQRFQASVSPHDIDNACNWWIFLRVEYASARIGTCVLFPSLSGAACVRRRFSVGNWTLFCISTWCFFNAPE